MYCDVVPVSPAPSKARRFESPGDMVVLQWDVASPLTASELRFLGLLVIPRGVSTCSLAVSDVYCSWYSYSFIYQYCGASIVLVYELVRIFIANKASDFLWGLYINEYKNASAL
jgi:hypothetical protein